MTVPPDISDARRHTLTLLDARQPEEALRAAAQLPADDPNAVQILAFAEIERGEQLTAPEVVRRGVERLAKLEERVGVSMAYNRANGHLALWTLAVQRDGVAHAHAEHRVDLHAARDLYATVGADEDLDEQVRCQALVNLGNSFDNCGRYADALVAYGQALTIRPDFTMALGNRGTTLLHRAALEDVHQHALVCEAVAAFDAALADPNDVVAHGGPTALASFQADRARISGTPAHNHDHQSLDDPYFEWCRRGRLFLHPSQRCITRETKVLDRLPLGGMTVKIDKRSQQQLKTLQDSLNSLLQDYLAVRFLAWSVLEPETSLREHAAAVSAHASFYDSLTYARWGVGTGLRVAAVAAATNLLDKVAGVAHQYMRTGHRASHAYFRRFGLLPAKKNQPDRVDPIVAAELDAGNRGLLALCDLAGELERATPLNHLLARRHAATHRTVAVHHMLLDSDNEQSAWLDRVEGGELADALLDQLGRARAALVYVADCINDRERRTAPEGPIVTMPSWPAEPERPDDW
jgi:tetratricopeptide (TPR) repeat protein